MVADIANPFHLKQRKSQTGQAQILAAALFLLLIPTTIIVAQNVTDNPTGDMTANITVDIPSENATENITSPPKETEVPVPNKSETEEGTTLINETNLTTPLNDTNTTIPEENITINITLPLNETNTTLPGEVVINTIPEANKTNVTIPDNQTQELPEQEKEEVEPEALGPVLEVNLNIPERANRNEAFILSAEITNFGDTDARDVEIEWILPDGLSILAGSGSHYCDVPAGATCTNELKAAASLSSELGEQEIKVLVRYFE